MKRPPLGGLFLYYSMFSVFGAQMNRVMNRRRNQRVSVYSKLDDRKKIKGSPDSGLSDKVSSQKNYVSNPETSVKAKRTILNRELKRAFLTIFITISVLILSYFIISWVIDQLIYINS